ncbi:MAG: DUF1697 domain-containing protein [Pyrinomonadaceae bacterium]
MRYIALLRGINLGGKTMVKMEELRTIFEALGLKGVKTYINSGNAAFDTRTVDEGKLTAMLEGAMEKTLGKAIPVMVRNQPHINEILDKNPFEGQYESHKEMQVLFLKEVMPTDDANRLAEAALPGERYAVRGREIYAHLPVGVAGSLLTKMFIEKKLKTVYTGRNWRTVQKLAEL